MAIMVYDGVVCIISQDKCMLIWTFPDWWCSKLNGDGDDVRDGVCDAIENKSGWMVFVVESKKWRFGKQQNFWVEDMDRTKLDKFGGESCKHDNMKGLKIRK